jgi:hypothetical protein
MRSAKRHVRFGSLADIATSALDVPFLPPKADICARSKKPVDWNGAPPGLAVP